MKPTARGPIFAPDADWVRLLEAFGAPIADDAAWARSLLEAAAPSFRCRAGLALYVVEDTLDRSSWTIPFSVSIGGAAGLNVSPENLEEAGQELLNAFHYPAGLVSTQEEILRRVSEPARDFVARSRQYYGHADALGMSAHPEPGSVVTLTAGLAERTILTPHERKILSQVTLHLESAYRLRKRPEAVRAILTPRGKIVHREDGDLGASGLAERVSRIEQSRTRSRRRQPEALDLWGALVEGEASIVERFDGGKRYYVVLDNPPSRRRHRALTRREAEIVRMSARGLPAKVVAYGLGVSSTAVSGALASSAAKLGLASRLGLLRAVSLLLDTPQQAVDPAKLTESEREIFELVRRGLSNQEIARKRRRSVRTVANQVGSILRKTDSAGRRALAMAKSHR